MLVLCSCCFDRHIDFNFNKLFFLSSHWVELKLLFLIFYILLLSIVIRGCVDDFSFFHCLSPFCFLIIEFHYTFFISYKILTNYVNYYCILIIVNSDSNSDRILIVSDYSEVCRTSFFFCDALLFSIHTHAALLTYFVCFFVLFRSCCSHVRVFGKTFVHETTFPIAILNVTWLLPTVQLQLHNINSERNTRIS